MKRKIALLAAVLCLTMALSPAVLAAEPTQAEVCYPTAVTQSEDGAELRKMYDLGPEDDPAGIPRMAKQPFRVTEASASTGPLGLGR